MTIEPHGEPRPKSAQRILIRIWVINVIVVLAALVYPVGTGLLRLATVTSALALWILTLVLLRRRRAAALGFAALGLLFAVFLILPGRPVEPGDLRAEYLRQLRAYEGTRYVWGGENGRGIDCSGLVRRSLINAHVHLALTTANPQALRAASNLWWYDCSALALREEYRALTCPVFTADSINTITSADLLPGDIAVTASGVHVLAYLGNHQWIQAEPGAGKVIILSAPHENGWFEKPVHIMRWTDLNAPTNPARLTRARGRP